ncbi:hypothetical protein P4O66_011233 [Electrophorus voltai]|uniref:Cadherin-20 n=1 Tax=Electrophorus voltai TaxID=2609070 RepID=A0AAD8Z846_9TELE|nr:hypothetical protein P4O66_011233 [Electrophorus voltai]
MADLFLRKRNFIIVVIVLTTLIQVLVGNKTTNDMRAKSLRRAKRGWVWNQFFVLEEYTEQKPLYIGKPLFPCLLQLHSDMDKGDGSIKYILSGEGAGTTFTLDDSTGDIHAIQRLDREVKAQYVLRAQARQRETGHPLEPESEFIVKIQDINDNEPKFLDGPYFATIPEMSPIGTFVIQVTATDADDPSYGNSARVVYSILEGQPYFSVDPKTGEVHVSLADMDREVKEQYHLVIQAKDMGGQLGGLAGTTTVNITLSDVNDNPPKFTKKLYQMSVLESGPVSSVVDRIEAKDRDLGINAEMRYSIIDGDGRDTFDISTDASNLYGVITIKKHLDFERKRSYTLKVEGSNAHIDPRFINKGLFSDVTIVHVSVEDVDEPPEFEYPFYYVEVPEDAEIGTILTMISARDPDVANSSVRYSIERMSDPDKYFYMDITSGSLITVLPLDREEVTWHNLTVLAMEMNNPLMIGSVSVAIKVLDVNDNPPSLTQYYEAFVCENAQAGQLIQTVTAIDPDEPTGGQHFYYSLAPEAANNPNFTLRDNQVMLMLMLTLQRHRKKPYLTNEEENVHENIVCYDDEGGGEEDTEAFDIAALWNPHAEPVHYAKLRQDMLPEIQSLSRYVSQTCVGGVSEDGSNVYSYMLTKLYEADLDPSAPPYDSLQTYAYEGEGSVAESLSSLQSPASHSDHNYDYLNDWGPRFHKLAEMYGAIESKSNIW